MNQFPNPFQRIADVTRLSPRTLCFATFFAWHVAVVLLLADNETGSKVLKMPGMLFLIPTGATLFAWFNWTDKVRPFFKDPNSIAIPFAGMLLALLGFVKIFFAELPKEVFFAQALGVFGFFIMATSGFCGCTDPQPPKPISTSGP